MKYDYMADVVLLQDEQTHLTEMGRAGWRLVAVLEWGEGLVKLYFVRDSEHYVP